MEDIIALPILQPAWPVQAQPKPTPAAAPAARPARGSAVAGQGLVFGTAKRTSETKVGAVKGWTWAEMTSDHGTYALRTQNDHSFSGRRTKATISGCLRLVFGYHAIVLES